MTPDITDIAQRYRAETRATIDSDRLAIKVVLLLASEAMDCMTYARHTRQGCEDVGIDYQLRKVPRLDLEDAILQANADPAIHGIFVYFPVFGNEQDIYLRNLVDYRKDIEGLSLYWTRKLYANDRTAAPDAPCGKAVLPCTPVAIVKLLQALGEYGTHAAPPQQTQPQPQPPQPLQDRHVTIFNRSEVIGRPLAVMMSNDGAQVYSFDINGPLRFSNARPYETDIDRTAALAASHIVITGVPNNDFPKISARELRDDAICVNFSSLPNFADDISHRARLHIPRVGPMTVAMCMRNALRLYQNFHATASRPANAAP